MVTQVLDNMSTVRRLNGSSDPEGFIHGSVIHGGSCRTPLANKQARRSSSSFIPLATSNGQKSGLAHANRRLSANLQVASANQQWTAYNQINNNKKPNLERDSITRQQELKLSSSHHDKQTVSNKLKSIESNSIHLSLKITDPNVSPSVRRYIEQKAQLMGPKSIYICDGSEPERAWLLDMMAASKIITPLRKRKNCWLARTDPRDVARVESKTFICTRDKHDIICRGATKEGALGNWMDIEELDARMGRLLPGCMAGRTMFVIPFSMGPIGSPMSKVGVQLTDSPYVVSSMMIMTRVSKRIFNIIRDQGDSCYVRCIHSVGCPLPLKRPMVNNWPCNPEETIVSHIPERREIISFGSGYGGNSLLGKKCFALRLGSIMGYQEGWLAEHMLILAITNPLGIKRYIAAAFPSACGKTNLAMMTPTLPGYKIECVGDDIAWMRFDHEGTLRAINPEAGFFGVAPGTNEQSNPNAMKTIDSNTIFTNTAETSDGDFFWEGLEHKLDNSDNSLTANQENNKETIRIIDWLNKEWLPESGSKSAHPNSRFCCPASQCPIMDPEWESPVGVPISAIIFGGRRPEGVPLIYEAFNWAHGVFMGASMRSESTAAAEYKGKAIMHDPFAMRPFFGYNFGNYLKHWLSFGRDQQQTNDDNEDQQKGNKSTTKVPLKLPKIFHVNWFRRDKNGGFLWPGFGENSRVLDWIFRRVEGEQCAQETPIGLVPSEGSINLKGLEDKEIKLDELFHIDKSFWLEEQQIIDDYLEQNVALDTPTEIREQNELLRLRLEQAE